MSQDEVSREPEVPEGPPAPPDSPAASPSKLDTILHQPLTKIQAMVGVAAGLITITGSIVSLAGLHERPPVLGEMIAVIQDMRERAPLPEATGAPAAPAEKTPPVKNKATKPAKVTKPPKAHEKAHEPVKAVEPVKKPAPSSAVQPQRGDSP